MSQPLCINCRFWAGISEKSGFCRRYAPHALIMVTGQPATSIYWPITVDKDWCGEYEAKA